MVSLFLVSLFAFCVNSQNGNASDDKITNLPGLNFTINFDQYSGYLDLPNGHHLYYWLTESQNKPATDPVVLWLNGGPGCSSLDGLLYENGPIHVTETGSLYQNIYAWNKVANMIYLDSPICVGYSFTDDMQCIMDDNRTADDTYNALLIFFKKFPNFVNNDFYVTGESYAGVYVPTLVNRILTGNTNKETTKINLKAFAVGNAFSSLELMDDSTIWYAYYHGLLSEKLWDSLMESCCTSPYTRQTCPFSTSTNKQCQSDVNHVMNVVYGGQLNWYNIYGDCLTTTTQHKFSYKKYIYELSNIHKKFHQSNGYKYIKQMIRNYHTNVPCVDTNGADIYLNREDVKSALHVSPKVNQKWAICSSILNYTYTYADLTDVYKQIFAEDRSIYGMLYNGDTDLAGNFLHDQWFVDDLKLPMKIEWNEWFYGDNNGRQVAGWVKYFERISFVTVRGSGHMVPQFKPVPALKLFQAFLGNQTLGYQLKI